MLKVENEKGYGFVRVSRLLSGGDALIAGLHSEFERFLAGQALYGGSVGSVKSLRLSKPDRLADDIIPEYVTKFIGKPAYEIADEDIEVVLLHRRVSPDLRTRARTKWTHYMLSTVDPYTGRMPTRKQRRKDEPIGIAKSLYEVAAYYDEPQMGGEVYFDKVIELKPPNARGDRLFGLHMSEKGTAIKIAQDMAAIALLGLKAANPRFGRFAEPERETGNEFGVVTPLFSIAAGVPDYMVSLVQDVVNEQFEPSRPFFWGEVQTNVERAA